MFVRCLQLVLFATCVSVAKERTLESESFGCFYGASRVYCAHGSSAERT